MDVPAPVYRVLRAAAAMPPRIVFAIDDHYVPPLCVALVSLWKSHLDGPPDLHVTVLHDGLGDIEQAVIVGLGRTLGLRVDLLEVPRSTTEQPVTGWWSRAMYHRLAIPDLLPEDQVVLYLDADTLILDDLRPLLATDVSQVCLAAVRDHLNPILSLGNALPGWPELGLAGETEYFNSGVMLMNLERWRSDGIQDRCWAFLAGDRDRVRFWDQDALNFVVADRWLRLDRRWNTFPLSALLTLPGERYGAGHILPLSSLLDDEPVAAVIHFVGPVKPWDSAFPAGPTRTAYERMSEETRQLLAGATPCWPGRSAP